MIERKDMSNKVIEIEPLYLLNEKWMYDRALLNYEYFRPGPPMADLDEGGHPRSDLPSVRKDFPIGDRKGPRIIEPPLVRRDLTKEEEKWIRWIRGIRIEIAEGADTRSIVKKRKYDYVKSEIGMNIIIPKGNIKEMRFYVRLLDVRELENPKVIAIDGFPKDVISQKDIKGGKVKIAVDKLFKFIPMFGAVLAGPIKLELGPWEFKLGSLKKVNVDFSGGLTSRPEWYFKKNGIKNDLRVALTIKKPKEIKHIKGKIRAGWLYDPGFLRKVRLGTDTKIINIF